MTTPTPASGSGPADTNLKQGDIGDAAVPAAPAPEDDSAASARSGRRWLRPALSGLVSVAIVVAVFWYFIPQFTSVSDIWSSIQAMTWLELTTLVIAALWNLVTYGLVMMSTTPGLRYAQAEVSTQASTAVANTVPGGGAIGMALIYSMLGSWGFSRSRISVSLVVSGVWNNFVKLGMPVVALALLVLGGNTGGGRVVAAIIGLAALITAIVLLTLLLRSESAARQVGLGTARVATALRKPFGKAPVHGWDLATVKFRQRTQLLIRARWIYITAITLISHLSLYFVLLLALRHVGVSQDEVSWVEVLAVFAFARLLTAIPLTPGGLGIIEVALITGLAAAGGGRADVAAAVLVYRALTFVLPIPLGLGCYLFWKRNRSWRRAPGAAPRTDLVPESA
jgi:putative heme transporter